MNILEVNRHNIKYIGINTSHSTSIPRGTINYFVQLVDFGKIISLYSYCYQYLWNKLIKTPCNSSGIFLGSPSDIDTIINSKINTNSPDTFKSVYFDSSCEYPRYRISAISNIKRTKLSENADSVIIPYIKFNEYNPTVKHSWILDNNKTILYSKIKNCYYLIDFYPDELTDGTLTKEFNTLIDTYKTPGLSRQQEWVSVLINSEIIPNDVIIFYQGELVLLNNEEILFLNNVDSYQNITYLEEFDRYISSLQPIPTPEDLISLDNMLKSHDKSVVELGIKLLSTYNIRESLCSLGRILIENWNNIDYGPVINSANMKYILNIFGFSNKALKYRTSTELLNRLYKKAKNKNDKEAARNLALERIKSEINNLVVGCKDKYSNFEFQVDINIK